MARSVDQIQQQIIADKESRPELAGLTSTSRRAIWWLWTFVVAAPMAYLEQLMDEMTAEINLQISKGAPASAAWIQKKVFEFQYDAVDPQIIQLIDTVPQYVIVRPELRIISRVSITTTLNNVVLVKVATGEPPAALDALQKSSLQGFLNVIGTSGITYVAVSEPADRLYLGADVYFLGDYGSVIQANVIAAINAFLAKFSQEEFNGSLLLSDLIEAVKKVPGVNDFVLRNVRARRSTDPFASATYLVQNQLYISRLWATVAGYIVEEDTSGQTFADSLNFIVT